MLLNLLLEPDHLHVDNNFHIDHHYFVTCRVLGYCLLVIVMLCKVHAKLIAPYLLLVLFEFIPLLFKCLEAKIFIDIQTVNNFLIPENPYGFYQ